MSVTIKDIARNLNISFSSVSKALNDKPGVSEKTRKRVLEEAKRLSYTPNALARGLVKNESKTIGVIIPDISNAFFSEVVDGIMDGSKGEGYTILLCVTNWNIDIEKEYIRILQEKRVDGIILKPSLDIKDRDFSQEINLPYVLLEDTCGNIKNTIRVNNFQGGYVGTKHLIERNYKKIAFLGGSKRSYTNQMRIKGYLKALEDFKVGYKGIIRYGGFNIQSGYNLTKRLLEEDRSIDAIFAANDVIAIGVLDYAKKLGNLNPDKLGILGYDNIIYSQLPQINLTTIDQPKYDLGYKSVELIINLIKGKFCILDEIEDLQPTLIKRSTTR